MTEQKLQSLIKKDKYQVFIFTCPCSIPLNFAKHTWLVVNKKGTARRWDVHFRIYKDIDLNKKSGYLYMDLFPATLGIDVLPYLNWIQWQSELIKIVEGGENSVAQKMIEIIEYSQNNYPYRNKYAFKGPNSNTYVQWVLNHFPELSIKLPWNAFGKNYRK